MGEEEKREERGRKREGRGKRRGEKKRGKRGEKKRGKEEGKRRGEKKRGKEEGRGERREWEGEKGGGEGGEWVLLFIRLCVSSCTSLQATFQVHQASNSVVTNMLGVGEGVWISFKMDSTLRLFNASSFTHMQDLDTAPSIHKILGEKTTLTRTLI